MGCFLLFHASMYALLYICVGLDFVDLTGKGLHIQALKGVFDNFIILRDPV